MNPNFFRFYFWFDRSPVPFVDYMEKFFIVLFVGVFVASIVLFVFKKLKKHLQEKTKQLLSSLIGICFWFALFGGFILFSRMQHAVYISMRIWFLLLFIVTGINIIRAILKYNGISILRMFQKKRRNEQFIAAKHTQEYAKYLPEHNQKRK